MEGNYKIADILLKVAVPIYYDKGEHSTKTISEIYKALCRDNAGFAPEGKVLTIQYCPDNAISEYGVFQFELMLDLPHVLKDLPETKKTEILEFIENYKPRR